jgi:hypothetical protein
MAEPLNLQVPSDAFEVAPHAPAGIESFGKKNAVTAMLAAERAKQAQTHYGWAESERKNLRTGNNLPIPEDKRDKTSGFDRRLPYRGPYLGYYVQNMKIFKGMTQQVKLKDVPETLMTPRRKMGHEVYEPEEVHVRAMVAFALDSNQEEILIADPLRCKICIEHKAPSEISLMAHFRKAHPTELDQLVDGMTRMEAELDEQAKEPVAAAPPRNPKQTFRAGA